MRRCGRSRLSIPRAPARWPTESRNSLPIIDHTPDPLRRALARRSARPAAAISLARPHHLLPRAAADRRRPHAVPLGRDGQAIPRRLRRASSPSPSGTAIPKMVEKVQRAGRQAAAHHDDLPAPDDRPVRPRSCAEHARGADAKLLHQLAAAKPTRSPSSRPASSPATTTSSACATATTAARRRRWA